LFIDLRDSKDAFSSAIKVPFFSPLITSSDKNSVLKTLNSSLLTDGPVLRNFEEAFAKFTGTKYAVGVSNATSALHLSLKSLGIGGGDEVIVPNMTFVATINAVILTGATPVIADVNEDLNISSKSVINSITKKTKAILPVHFAGKMCDMNVLTKIARTDNLLIIEDCAHALGSTLHKQHAGSFGDAGCFSFYPTKNITTIEGGMVITNSKKVAERIRVLRNHGIAKSLSQRYNHGKPWDYDITEPGYNYRLDEVRSSLGLNQLKSLTQLNQRRRKAFQYYSDKLKPIIGITPLTQSDSGHACHLYIIRVKKEFGTSRDKLFKKLLMRGIRTSVHYKPLSKFSTYRKYVRVDNKLENSESAYNEILSLPFYPQISKREQDFVIKCIRECNV
jgi:dTDP-4-amino-4,6-dideoxygalactose transaminase